VTVSYLDVRQTARPAGEGFPVFLGFFHVKLVSRATDNPYFLAGPNMVVEMEPINSIKPHEDNPRANGAAVDAVVASMKEGV